MTTTHRAYLITMREQLLGLLRACTHGNVRRILDTFLRVDEELSAEKRIARATNSLTLKDNSRKVLAAFMKEVDKRRAAKRLTGQTVTKDMEILVDN